MITLKQICNELKLDQREARERLRAADAKKHPALKGSKATYTVAMGQGF